MSDRPSFRSFLAAGAVAAVLGVAINALLFFLARATGAWSGTVLSPMGQPIDLSAVAALSVGPALVGAILAWALIRWVPRGRAVFLGLAALVFAAFLLPPFQLGAPAGMVAVLQAMHVVVAAATVTMVLRAAPSSGG